MTTQEMNTNITNTNESAEKKTNKKKAIGIVAVAAVTVAAVIIAMLTACGNKQPVATADEVIGTSVQTVTQVVTDSQGNTHIEEETKVVEVKQTQPAEKSEKATEVNAQNAAKTDSKQNNGGQSNNNSNGNSNQTNNNNNAGNGQTSKSNGSSGSTNKPASNSGSSGSSSQSKPSGGSSSSSSQSKPSSGSGSSSSSKPAPATQPATKDPHEGKTWHDAEYKTEKVWVVDEEGYTWEKPIYEKHTATICNTCGADITDCVGEHGYNHMINGENASYRVETVKELIGYETVEVPEKGHYETKTTLVRAAGWY